MNQPPLPLLDGDTLIVSPSQFDTLEGCPEAWNFKYVHRREANGPVGSLVAGKALDAAINLRYLKHGSDPATPETEAAMCAEIDKAFEGSDLPLDEYRTPTRFKEVVRLYNETWGAEPFRIHAVQLPFAVRLGEIEMPASFWERQRQDIPPTTRPVQILIHGILDMLVSVGNTAFVLDTKTMNDWGPRKLSEWDNAPQPKLYAWGMQELARQHPELGLPTRVHGFILNAVVVRPPYKREGSAAKSNAKPREEFHRHTIHYLPERLEEWRQNALDQVKVALDCFDRGRFIHNEKHCANHYGRLCPYHDVCTLPRDQRADCLGSDMYRNYKTADVFADAGEKATAP